MPADPWQERAACRLAGFGAGLAPEDATHEQIARHAERFQRTYCDVCPVRAECHAFAVEAGAKHGVFGGVSELIRATWVRNRRRYRCRECNVPLDPQRIKRGALLCPTHQRGAR